MPAMQTLKQYFKEQFTLFLFVSVLFVVGVVFGAVMVNALSLEQKQELGRYLSSFYRTIEDGAQVDGKQSMLAAFSLHMKWILLIWTLGLSVIGLPLILVLDFLKGVLIGFSVGFMVGQLSWKGIAFALVSIAPPNLIVVPAILICSVVSISFSLFIIKNRLVRRSGTIYHPFMRYSGVTLAMGVCMLGAALLEAFVSPTMMKWVTPMLAALTN
ncbi:MULTISPECIES: stage II sporulation protein M [Paenibacillus]|uniref:stage II sporulation protein M n=1 Tax=Paenibacillus TaxID=44249 RepID=UPI00020D686F|nr:MULTISPECIES: stage II sporulation protein M [Paenibacillus]EGL17208.1 stage II sporulation protein M [Paenibacillus sp. HGF7]EPD80703.1 stage II sporulation protein M [Paenibacillus sp. HGH0039]MBV6714568.1 stage II sporulation protein M [Paenibacillus chitinolyticus]